MTASLVIFHQLMSLFLGGGIILSIASYFRGGWGEELRKNLDHWKWLGVVSLAPLVMVILFKDSLYPWKGFSGHKAIYFSDAFVIMRQIVYIIALFFAFKSLKMRPWISLILYFVVGSFFAYDWGLSLEKEWFSNLYGLIYLASGALASIALMLLLPMEPAEKDKQDLIHLYVANALLWLYLEFCQFLIVWMGNIPREMAWYIPRLKDGMLILFIIVPILKVIPGIALATQKRLRKNPKVVNIYMIMSLIGFLLEMIWFVWPSLKGET